MSNINKDRIEQLQKAMSECGLDMYFIPMDDCHNSEYVGDHFKTIEFFSGFTGSAAQMVITADEAYLWTDGRYFLQAASELEGSGIQLMRMGQDGVPRIEDFINSRMLKGNVIGFEGKNVSTEFAEKISGRIKYDADLASRIWEERPEQIFTKIRLFDEYSGESTESKLERLRGYLSDAVKEKCGKEHSSDYIHVINSLDDIAWLFNIRANDVAYNPVAYAYAAITADDAWIFTGKGSTDDGVLAYFESTGVKVKEYGSIQNDCLKALDLDPETGAQKPVIILDLSRISYDMYRTFTDNGYEVVNVFNPTSRMKAVKNSTEIANTRQAQIKDGAALVRFMKWIKENCGTKEITECDVADKLVELRSGQEGFIEPSFETIAGYASNAAIIHYEPVRGTDALIKPVGMLLVDSGGHYLQGTTDTTRTFILGEISEEEKKCFTLVAASMLRLLDYDSRKSGKKFNGLNCDLVARELIREHGYDFNHGTGHGIGYVLNVHENPPVISGSRAREMAAEEFIPGMITSNEPGIYIDGSFGIRTENDMLVVEKEDEEGKYLAFENLTFVPVDTDGIDKQYLNEEDIERLNNFNRSVYETLEPVLDEETCTWLKQYTMPI